MGLRNAALLGLFATGMAATAAQSAQGDGAMRVYVGTYTGGGSEGIYVLEMDPGDGSLSMPVLAGAAENPSFLARHPDGRFLFAVGEVSEVEGKPGGAVRSFAIEPADGTLSPINLKSSGGAGPCHIVVDGEGRNALVANYGGGTVAVLPIGPDGAFEGPSDVEQHQGSGPDPRRQDGPHAHSINLGPSGRFAVAADLGLDRLFVYRYDPEAGTLTANDPPSAAVEPGAGPRHFTFHPDGRHAYVINEMASTVTALDYDAEAGTLSPTTTVSTLPEGFDGSNTTADVHVHPSGRFLYGSNRGHDSIAIFAIDEQTGALTPAGHCSTGGRTPRNFNIDPSGRFLLAANQDSDSIVVLRIDPETGALEPTGASVEVPKPVCILFATEDGAGGRRRE